MPDAARRLAKTFFPGVAAAWRIHSPKAAAIKQDSLIFADCIDFPSPDSEITHPIK
jgi:hypothetical protein